jgi:putative transposase
MVAENLGGKEVFECPNCGHTVHRDLNGATGIFVRRLVITVDDSVRGKPAADNKPAL